MTDVVLVSMPFGTIFSPSLGLSLLKASVANSPISVDILYFSVRFAELIGPVTYENIAVNGSFVQRELAGEWVFAGQLRDETEADVRRYIDDILVKRQAQMAGRPVRQKDVQMVLRARSQTGAFLDDCLADLVERRPRIVGFTSIFQQHVASLALARRLKQACPDTFIVFGGANCEGVMGAETLRQFPWVDAVVSGEGDLVFPELVRRVLNGESVSDLQGVRTHDRLAHEFNVRQFPNAPSVRQMDDLPYPDYTDFSRQFEASRMSDTWIPSMLAETSRGCWWGERMHCTFCGLNGETMSYRSKSAERAIAELTWLRANHPDSEIQVVDNILDLAYFKTLLPELAARGLGFDLFYETKSNLKKDQVRLLRAAGVNRIQPGIESFSDAVLKLTNKGVSGLQNIQLLKWCKEVGVEVVWNLLWGFAGEPEDEYARMSRLVPSLVHLSPPTAMSRLRLDRFSPNFAQSERLGFVDVKPLVSYQHVYGLPEPVLANLAYYFGYGYREPRTPEVYVAPLGRRVRRWQRVHTESDLFAVDTGEHLVIWDLRTDLGESTVAPVTVLDGLDRRLYHSCDAACDIGHLSTIANADRPDALSRTDVEARLAPLVSAHLMVQSGGRYLSLAIPLGDYSPPPPVVSRFHALAARLGRSTSEHELVLPLDELRQLSATDRWQTRPQPVARGGSVRRGARSRSLSPNQFAVNRHGELVVVHTDGMESTMAKKAAKKKAAKKATKKKAAKKTKKKGVGFF